MRTRTALPAVLAALCLGLAACGDDEDDDGGGSARATTTEAQAIEVITGNADNASKPRLTIGSKNFTEEFILGEIYAQALEAAGYKVKKQLNLGSEQIALKALKSGRVDAYPEYTGTALTSLLQGEDRRRAQGRARRLRGQPRTAGRGRASRLCRRRRSPTPTASR